MKTDEKTVTVEHRFGESDVSFDGADAPSADELRAVAAAMEMEQLLHLTECSQATDEQRRAAVAALALDYQTTPLETEIVFSDFGFSGVVAFILESGRPLSERLPVPEGLPVAPGLLDVTDPMLKGPQSALEAHRKRCELWALRRRKGLESIWPDRRFAPGDGEQ